MTLLVPYRQRRPLLIIGMALSGLLAGACAYEWDGYDPRLAAQCVSGATRICYTGPAATEGIGVCASGEQACEMGRWGPCVGEVVPGTEDCDSDQDEDCDGRLDDPEDGCSCEVGILVSCYDGPEGTAGVGLCRNGSQLCSAIDGDSQLGPCLGAVLPSHETCGSVDPADEDCDGVTDDHCATWAQRYAGSSHAHSYDLRIAGDGDVLLTGDHHGALDFGGETLTKTGTRDAYVVRLSPDGTQERWHTEIDGSLDEYGRGLAIDPLGDVIVVGEFTGTLEIPPLPSVTGATGSNTDAYVAKLNGETGEALWMYTVEGSGSDSALDVAVDFNNDIWVVGYFNGTANFGDGAVSSSGRDGFIVKLSESGTLIHKVLFGGSQTDQAHGVAIEPGLGAAAGVYVVGQFLNPIDIGGGMLSGGGDVQSGFMAKLDLDGNHIWSRALSASRDAIGYQVAVDADLSVVAVGEFGGSINLGDGTIGGSNDRDIFIVKYDSSGAHLWDQGYGDNEEQLPRAIAFGEQGQVYVGASMHGVVRFGDDDIRAAATKAGDLPAPLTSRHDMLLLVHDANGNPLWARRFGTSRDQDLRGLGVTSGGSVLITGDCSDTLDFGDGLLLGDPGRDDICLASIAP